jgi:AbrB family looped-hinge helix DNA binding protein
MGIEHRLTSKSQVTIPKDARAALGVKAGDKLRFESEPGVVHIFRAETASADDSAEFQKRLKKAQALFKKHDTMPGVSVDNYMAMIREPLLPGELDASG